MFEFIKGFGLAFVPIFVAVDAIGILPLYMGLTEGAERQLRNRILRQAMITALVLAIGFTFLGKAIFELIGVSVADFKVAGGVVLFIIATIDIVSSRRFTREVTTLGAVPLGTPLIVGPAVLTTAIIMAGVHGYAPTLAALVINILFAGVLMWGGERISRAIGQPASRAMTKVANLILAAFAVMMVRNGILAIIDESVKGARP